MFLKVKHILLFVAVFSISFFTLQYSGNIATVHAEETTPEQATAYPLNKSENPSCAITSRCEHHQHCCKQSKECCCGSHCSSNHTCHSHCKTHGGYKKEGDHCVSDMLKLARCAKKELLKEKLKANLEKKVGDKLDKVADLLVDAMLEEYKADMENKERRDELKKNLCEIFSEKGSQ
ncbi:MAG: hypothetical protein MRJ65_15275 [Candidatus Brocadiaceae bacterium]|nr:hypothetical protein [Candidatus Brocadiaceae bacterium]